jgi:hypothetical protein
MNISVPVICNDITIEVSLDQLLKYPYFKNVLSGVSSNGITKMDFKKHPTVDINGNSCIIYAISVPYITVECSSKVLLRLFQGGEYFIPPNNYTDELIEIMTYNDMYGTRLKLKNLTYGLDINVYFDMLIFIKHKLPTVNAYYFLEKSGFWTSETFITHSFKLCAQNKLDFILIEDLLPYLHPYLLINSIYCFNYNELILSVLDTIVNCCVTYKDIIEKKINNEIIKNMLHEFVKNNKYSCTYDAYFNDRNKNIITYNDTLEKIFVILQKLADENIIVLNNIGTIQEFQIYKTD